MNREEAEANVREALRLLQLVHKERHSLQKYLPSNGRRYTLISRFAAFDACFHASRLLDQLSDSPSSVTADEVTADPSPARLGG
jgi:hypothetical protein